MRHQKKPLFFLFIHLFIYLVSVVQQFNQYMHLPTADNPRKYYYLFPSGSLTGTYLIHRKFVIHIHQPGLLTAYAIRKQSCFPIRMFPNPFRKRVEFKDFKPSDPSCQCIQPSELLAYYCGLAENSASFRFYPFLPKFDKA